MSAADRLIRTRKVSSSDRRDSMTRLLEDGLTSDGLVVVSFAQQWPTLAKAQRCGFVDADNRITALGRARLAKATVDTRIDGYSPEFLGAKPARIGEDY